MRRSALPVIWLLGVLVVLWTARWPNPYVVHVVGIPPPHPYPLIDVLWVVVLMTLQIGAQVLVLRPQTYSRSWGRSLIAAAVTIPFLAFASLLAMHAPPYTFVYLWWMILTMLGLLALSVWSGVAQLTQRHAT